MCRLEKKLESPVQIRRKPSFGQTQACAMVHSLACEHRLGLSSHLPLWLGPLVLCTACPEYTLDVPKELILPKSFLIQTVGVCNACGTLSKQGQNGRGQRVPHT